MQTIDITPLDFQQLDELRERIIARMIEMRDTGVAELRARFITDAAAFGLAPEDILAPARKSRRKRRSPKSDDAFVA